MRPSTATCPSSPFPKSHSYRTRCERNLYSNGSSWEIWRLRWFASASFISTSSTSSTRDCSIATFCQESSGKLQSSFSRQWNACVLWESNNPILTSFQPSILLTPILLKAMPLFSLPSLSISTSNMSSPISRTTTAELTIILSSK